MIKYNPTHNKYESDSNIRPSTQHNQAIQKMIKYDSRRENRGDVIMSGSISNFAKKSKKPSISVVPIQVCVGISHS